MSYIWPERALASSQIRIIKLKSQLISDVLCISQSSAASLQINHCFLITRNWEKENRWKGLAHSRPRSSASLLPARSDNTHTLGSLEIFILKSASIASNMQTANLCKTAWRPNLPYTHTPIIPLSLTLLWPRPDLADCTQLASLYISILCEYDRMRQEAKQANNEQETNNPDCLSQLVDFTSSAK